MSPHRSRPTRKSLALRSRGWGVGPKLPYGEGPGRMIANRDGGASRRASGLFTPRWFTGPDPATSDQIRAAMGATRDWLLDHQQEDGHWVGELEGDTILESEYVLMMAFLGRHREEVCVKACRYMLDQERPEGGWAIYPGGPFDLGATVKAYFALKLVGYPTDDPVMVRNREAILAAGGAQSCNSFTRFYLAILGQIDYDDTPSVPPELLFLPRWFFLSLSRMSSWTRTIVVPLSIISALKPVRKLGPGRGHRRALPRRPAQALAPTHPARRELGERLPRRSITPSSGPRSGCRGRGARPGVRAAHRWMLDHFENTDGLGAIFPPMIYTVIALRCLGYEAERPGRRVGDAAARRPAHRGGRRGPGPAVRLAGLGHGDHDDRPGRRRPARLPPGPAPLGPLAAGARDPRHAATGSSRGVKAEPSRLAVPVPQRVSTPTSTTRRWSCSRSSGTSLVDSPEVKAATERGVDWILAMQNRDGGWAAFDRDVDNQVLTKVPFADHNAILDPSCADITMRVVELLGGLGYRADHPAIARALDYIWKTQEPQGCWYGRWGINYIYGTWQVLQGLARDRLPDGPPQRQAGGRLARVGPAGRRRLGRVGPELRRPRLDGPGRADGLADRLGRARPDLGRPGQERGRPPGRPVPHRHARPPTARGSSTPSPAPASRGSST